MSVRWKKWGDGEVEDGRAMTARRLKAVEAVVSCDTEAGRCGYEMRFVKSREPTAGTWGSTEAGSHSLVPAAFGKSNSERRSGVEGVFGKISTC